MLGGLFQRNNRKFPNVNTYDLHELKKKVRKAKTALNENGGSV